MVSAELIFGTIAATVTVISGLFGGGLFRQALKHNGEMAIQRYKQEQTDAKVRENDLSIQKLNQDVALINKDIQGFSHMIKKLETLPEISSKLSAIEALMTVMREQIRDFRSERIDHDKNNN